MGDGDDVSFLLRTLTRLNVVRAVPDNAPCSDLERMPADPDERQRFVDAVMGRFRGRDVPPGALDANWPALQSKFLEQLADSRQAIAEFSTHAEFLRCFVPMLFNRSLASAAAMILLNAIETAAGPPRMVDAILAEDVAPAINRVLVRHGTTLDTLACIAELLECIAEHRQCRDASAFHADQRILAKACADGFARCTALYNQLSGPCDDASIEAFIEHSLDVSDYDLQERYKEGAAIVAVAVESLARAALLLHLSCSEIVSVAGDHSPLPSMALEALSKPGGVREWRPPFLSACFLADLLDASSHLDHHFRHNRMEHSTSRGSADRVYAEDQERLWDRQEQRVLHLVSTDSGLQRLTAIVDWIVSRARQDDGRRVERSEGADDATDASPACDIACVAPVASSLMSCIANIGLLKPLPLPLLSSLCALVKGMPAPFFATRDRVISMRRDQRHFPAAVSESVALVLLQCKAIHDQDLPGVGSAELVSLCRNACRSAHRRGRDRLSRGDAAAAIPALSTAIRLYELDADCNEYAECLSDRSECFVQQRQYAAAFVDARRAVDVCPDDRLLQERLGQVEYNLPR
ncbi:Uncharacterized protein PBTT_06856 [Plasmodiophora brassicae]|uniref:Uncharacterized protein n=1 Tax=Plasmodiophora brassicae TaxID=37360 RepID=A0A0G4J8F3_PLABS|nr:hypothetical protein PBRA_003515 [Plasmodiophora brassicae]SPQ99869.1 unnamed protein product [Plasmodiophora brassicae]